MNKKAYIKPESRIELMTMESQLMVGSGGDGAHDDDPQHPGGAMTRHNSAWEENEEDF